MIDFSNANLLGLTQNSEFLGDSLVRYRTVQQFQIRGNIYSLSNMSGVSPVWSGISGLVVGATDFDSIIINGINFGNGRVTSLKFDESTDKDVQSKPYTAQLETYSTGDLSSVLSGFYSGVDYSSFLQIKKLDETFVYNSNDNKKSYTHNVSLGLVSGQGAGSLVVTAQAIASNIFTHTNLTGFFGTYTGQYKKYYTEVYNLHSNEFSWSEKVDFTNVSGRYSHDFTQSLEVNENGITNIKEKGTIKGLILPIYESAQAGVEEQKALVYSRATGLFANYITNSEYPLFSMPLVQEYNINEFAGNIEYTLSFTNDPKYTGEFLWSYTNKLSRDSQAVYTVSENGSVVGFGRRLIDKFDKATAGYNNISGGIELRCGQFYSGNTNETRPLHLTSSSINRSMYEGKIDYTRSYNNDASWLSTTGIKKVDVQISDDMPNYLTSKYSILGFKEIVQKSSNLATQAKRNIRVNSIGSRGTTLPTYLSDANGRIANYTGFYNDTYVESVNYAISPISNNFDMNVTLASHTGMLVYGDLDV
jgi:hypothetical protein